MHIIYVTMQFTLKVPRSTLLLYYATYSNCKYLYTAAILKLYRVAVYMYECVRVLVVGVTSFTHDIIPRLRIAIQVQEFNCM